MYYLQFRRKKIGNCEKLKELRMLYVRSHTRKFMITEEQKKLYEELEENWKKEWLKWDK